MNFSDHILTEHEKLLLAKGLGFAIPSKRIKYDDYMLPFELLYRDIKSFTSPDKVAFMKATLAHTAFRSFKLSNATNLSPSEVVALDKLIADKKIIIQKSDKGNTVVICNKDSYHERMEDMLLDTTKFLKVDIPPGKELNAIINLEHHIRNSLIASVKKGHLSNEDFKKLTPTGSRPGIMYGLPKVHKPLQDGFPKFRPILSAIGTPTYNLCKFFIPLLPIFSVNEHTVKDSFSFAKDISSINAKYVMTSLDVESLFTNIPLIETIDICVELAFKETDTVHKMDKTTFKTLLTMAATESLFMFNGGHYKQIDGVAMGSPLGPIFANVFLAYHESSWLKNCPPEIQPILYKRYVDDIFLLFNSIEQHKEFLNYINQQHPSMKFTDEVEKDNTLPFLDINIIRSSSETFSTSVYRKPTFSGVLTNYMSNIHEGYKTSLVFTILHRCWMICSSYEEFDIQIKKVTEIFLNNGYPAFLVNSCIRGFLDKLFIKKPVKDNVPQKEIRVVLPYLGKLSANIKRNLENVISKNIGCCKLKVIFSSSNRMKDRFSFKDSIPMDIRSNVIYKFTCKSCQAFYVGKTFRHFKQRVGEHIGRSHLTGSRYKTPTQTAVFDHMVLTGHEAFFEDFEIISTERSTSDFLLRIRESLLINKLKPTLNVTSDTIPLALFK